MANRSNRSQAHQNAGATSHVKTINNQAIATDDRANTTRRPIPRINRGGQIFWDITPPSVYEVEETISQWIDLGRI